MTPLIFLFVALAGGVGCVCRFILDGIITARSRGALPWGTIIINVTGSLVLGFVTGLTIGHVLPEAAQLIVGTGFLGGYTTFSTASIETVRLLQERKWMASALNGFGTLVVSTALAGLGLWLGSLV
ncbi:MAG: fluoride efflux transporter CrcB [Microbacterium sp.]